jgi:mRNA interferase RelE/StbE
MPTNTAKLIRAKLRALAADPAALGNVKKLTGSPGYRLRVGDWRVLYEIHEGKSYLSQIEGGLTPTPLETTLGVEQG